ncbi:unnamed protein product [Nyctereutes procyonoides]|uniref:(raccoon dog) hypothetical protein n=1 Tax=Nyctereutes procyonoides TaxID=34880 RepID=A0A811ZX12_NYCPR|nr:unnamed protein product [Nyctereutes procyonoides]
MTVKKFWCKCMESELISRTSHCRMRTPPGTLMAAVSSEKESDMRGQQYFSGWTEAFPTKHETTQAMTKKLLEDILPRYGFPVRIGSDNGPGFISKSHMFIPCKNLLGVHSPNLNFFRFAGTNSLPENFKHLKNE